MAQDDLLVFVHIEKCAGTAVNNWLSTSHHYGNLYIKSEHVPVASLRWPDVRPVDLQDPNLRSVASHHLRTYPATVHGRTLRYMTLLRDPIARWVSYVRYFNLLHHGPAKTLREHAAWLLDQPEPAQFKQINGQTNHLVEHEWYRQRRDDVELPIDWAADPELLERYRNVRLAFAKETLSRFDVVGTVERINDFTRVLQWRAVGWDVPLIPIMELDHVHQTEGPQVDRAWITPDDPVGRRLLEAFADDIELHRFAERRLSADVANLDRLAALP
jgi:hypothetical protein